jgi:hypothetical protein
MTFILLINIDTMSKIFNIMYLQEACFERFENAFKRENSLGLVGLPFDCPDHLLCGAQSLKLGSWQ